NPDCPLCGRESVLATAWDGDYYTCPPCNRKAREKQEREDELYERIHLLEEQLKDSNEKGK
ncbi:MAG: hypothetical protein KAI79_18575, partial [Bacteroidales bacterium]|nr:hypothetical protein [Bacteroidales bacterium]